MQVEDAEAAIKPEQEDMNTAEHVGLTTRWHEKTFEEMMNAIEEILSDLASFNIDLDGYDEDNEEEEDTELGRLSNDEEPGWVMGTITKMVQQHMERSWPKRMKQDEWIEPGWGYAPDYFRETDKKHGKAELKVLAVVKQQTDTAAAIPAPTTFGELMETHNINARILQWLHGSSRPWRSHMRLGFMKPMSG